MNHSGVAPLPVRSARALQRWADEATTGVGEKWPTWALSNGRSRKNAAAILGCSADEIALVHNTTHGLLVVAHSVRWRPGDNVVYAEHEFPANIYPWRNLLALGVGGRPVAERDGKFFVEDFIERIDGRTKLVAISMVQYSTGFRMPVEALGEICRRRGILLCIDGIQAAGGMPVDVGKLGCDFFVADGHKWLLSAEGFGALYVRQGVIDQLNESMTGWIGRQKPGDYDDTQQPLVPGAKRFEEGSHAIPLAIVFEHSTGLLLEVGISEVWSRIKALTERLAEGIRRIGMEVVSPRGDGERSGIVAFRREGFEAKAWARELEKRRIFIAARRGWLRASPHFYNQPEQIDALLEALAEIQKTL